LPRRAARRDVFRDANRRRHAMATQPALMRPCAWACVAGSHAKSPLPRLRSTVFG
jgi:hypothetical protein